MLFLKFQIGADAYLLEAARVVEVLPLVSIKQIPRAPRGIAGMFNYRGVAVPALDVAELALDRPAVRRLSTRIVIARHEGSRESRLLGLIVEKATETLDRNSDDFVDAAVTADAAPYLGAVLREDGRLLQRIEIGRLLPEAVVQSLYRQTGETAWLSPDSKPC